MGGRHRLFAILFVAATLPCPAAANGDRMEVASVRCVAEVWIPANIAVDDDLLWSLTNEMARRSPTFRRQLLKIGAEPTLEAAMDFTSRSNFSSLYMAQTEIMRTRGGLLRAKIAIPIPLLFGHRYSEFVAHEIEHVIEQIEGLDLRELAGRPHSGVYRLDWGTGRPLFETDRAKSVGQIVEREFHDQAAGSSSCARLP